MHDGREGRGSWVAGVLAAVLRETAQLHGYVGARRVRASTLEHLAVSELARKILNFRRLRNRAGRLDAISASIRHGRIYPLFNQISSRTGLTKSQPNLFVSEWLPELMSCFERGVRDLFADPAQSLRTLAEETRRIPVSKERESRNSIVARTGWKIRHIVRLTSMISCCNLRLGSQTLNLAGSS